MRHKMTDTARKLNLAPDPLSQVGDIVPAGYRVHADRRRRDNAFLSRNAEGSHKKVAS